MKNKIRYTCSGYKYAPESFKCYMVVLNPDGINHSYYFIDKFSQEENTTIGNIYISKGKLAAEAEIKRLLRKMPSKEKYITYGYKILNENKYAYIEHLYISDIANINKKLSHYKTIKKYFADMNYIATEYTFTSAEINYSNDKKFENVKTEKIQYVLDKNNPKKVR